MPASKMLVMLPDSTFFGCPPSFKDFFQATGIEYVRFQWIDYSGVMRVRFIPLDRCFNIARGQEDYLIPQVSMIIPISTAPRSFPSGKDIETWILRPDWSSLRRCGFRRNHASVMCFVEHKEAVDPFSKCPRKLLARAVHDMDVKWNASLLLGFEIEITLLDGRSWERLDDLDQLDSYQTTAGLRGAKLDMVEEIVTSLESSAIKIHHFHTETRDQIEIALSPESPLDAVDSLISAQETIRTIFVKNNIKATMTPRPLHDGPTSGLHLHMSVDRLEAPGHFLAGVLTHMVPLCALGMANFDGYTRNKSDAAGAWVGYGTENRDLPVRKVNGRHWEFRMMDSTSNPYLFVGAVLRAGLSGLSEKTDLTWKDCKVFPHLLDSAGRADYGLLQPMPESLQEALSSLNDDATLIPRDLLDSYVRLKELEIDNFGKISYHERRLLFIKYF